MRERAQMSVDGDVGDQREELSSRTGGDKRRGRYTKSTVSITKMGGLDQKNDLVNPRV